MLTWLITAIGVCLALGVCAIAGVFATNTTQTGTKTLGDGTSISTQETGNVFLTVITDFGSGSISTAYPVASGSVVTINGNTLTVDGQTITATPEQSGYETIWSIANGAEIKANTTVTASFEIIQTILTIKTAGDYTLGVTIDSNNKPTYKIGASGPETTLANSQSISTTEANQSVYIIGGSFYFNTYCLGSDSNDSKLSAVSLGGNCTSIGDYTFSRCSGLTSINIPSTVTSIGSNAFYGCSGLKSITIGSNVTSIGRLAFVGCGGLTSINFSNSVKSIEYEAFYGCSGLTSINIPSSVTSIGGYAFIGCNGLTSITVASGNTIYNDGNDSNCIIQTSSNTLIAGCKTTSIPNTVTSIGNAAFRSCSGLTSITFPSSVTSIGSYAFHSCRGLTSITIPNSVKSIGREAFSNCSGLTSVTIGSNVTTIGSYAFYSCSGLTSITIPSSVTSIGEYAFYNCTALTSVAIGSNVTSIGNEAFSSCSGLTTVTFEGTVAQWNAMTKGTNWHYNVPSTCKLIIGGTEYILSDTIS